MNQAKAALSELPRVAVAGEWDRLQDGRFYLAIDVALSVAASAFVTSSTRWYLVVSHPAGSEAISVLPARAGGVDRTFPHQLHNGLPETDVPWRTGKLCLDRPEAAFSREVWSGEPVDLVDRLLWTAHRLLSWIDAAAADVLRVAGDPFEIPPTPTNLGLPVVAFNESISDLGSWNAQGERWGHASLIEVPKARSTFAISSFQSPDSKEIRRNEWGTWAGRARRADLVTWIRLDEIPVMQPWGLPTTWLELSALLNLQGVDLASILGLAGAARRKRSHRAENHLLVLGFPVPEEIGATPSRLHWLAINRVPLAARHSVHRGFRPTEQTRLRIDGEIAASRTPINWIRTMNWAADQTRRRGPVNESLATSRIVLIGAGALGGPVAENFVRMGNTTMTIMDDERLEAGNLTRHVLGLEALGHNKAQALAAGLNSTMVDARVTGLAERFPPTSEVGMEALRNCDVVIDCTGSDETLRAMSEFDWRGEKLFLSLAITWGAEGLLAYAASETHFPAVDAIERFAQSPAPPVDPAKQTMEGTGCWHPVFPANAEDMRLWASIGCRFIRAALDDRRRSCVYFRQFADGRIERQDV